MKNLILSIFSVISLQTFAQNTYHFKNNENNDSQIYILYKDNIKDFKPIKSIRNKYYMNNSERNSFENQLNDLANLCIENGGNAIRIKNIQNLGEHFVMNASVYTIEPSQLKNQDEKTTQTELIIYRPKYFTGIVSEFSKLEILINNEPLNLKKGEIFHKKVSENEEVFIEIPKHKIKEKINLKNGEKNFLRFVLQQEMPRNSTFSANQITIPLGKVFPTFNEVSEIQANVEMDNMK